jgi:hypothetical protein
MNWVQTRKAWDAGLDKPFLLKLLKVIHEGKYGGLGKGVMNSQKLVPVGYSVGAQMVSWLIQVRCAFFGRNLHSRMPLDPTHVRLKRTFV